MASGLTDYLANLFLEYLVSKADVPVMPANAYVALCTTAPTRTAAGTAATYTGYARKQTAAADWAAAGAAAIQNAAAITFAAATAGSETITHFEIWDAAAAGNRLAFGALTAGLAVSAGITPSFAIGDLDINISPT